MYEIGNAKKMNGFILPPPNVELGNNSVKTVNKGAIMLGRENSLLKHGGDVKNWVFIYSTGKNSFARDRDDADDALKTLNTAGKTYGVKFAEPGFIEVSDMNADTWKKLLHKDQQDNGKPSFILLMFKPAEEKFYSKLKKYITNELGTISQFVKKRTFTGKNALSCASKLLIQISCKIGNAPWEMRR